MATFQWFVEPLNSHTNSVVKGLFDLEGDIYDFGSENTKDGKQVNVFRCNSYKTVGELLRCRNEKDLKLRIYVRRGSYGPLKEWTLYGKKSRVSK
jgi:hypothetical protein